MAKRLGRLYYGQQHLTVYTCSSIIALMLLKQERYKVLSVKSDVLLTVPTVNDYYLKYEIHPRHNQSMAMFT
jgi:hypothetical protein